MTHLKWGILATGRIAGRFATGLQTTGEATALAVASRDLAKAQAFAKEHGVARAYGSYDELLADPDVDAIYIATPNHLHAPWSIKCAEAGKHILCEKPATLNAAELETVLSAVKRCDVFFMEAFMYRCHPQWARLREVIDAGTIGEVRIIESNFAFNMGMQFDNVRMSNPMGGGGLMDVGCYCVSFSRLVAAEEPVECHAVACIGPEARVDHYAAGILKFPSGAVACFGCAMQCAVPILAAVYGSKGSIVVNQPWFPDDDTARLTVTAGDTTETIEVTHGLDLYANEALAVAENLDARQSPLMSWDDSLGQARTLDALRRSMGLVFDPERG